MADTPESNPEVPEGTEYCENSLLPKETCWCIDCTPIYYDISSRLLECRNVDEVLEKLHDMMEYFTYIRFHDFEIRPSQEGDGFGIAEGCLVGDSYWTRCEGCGYPMLVPQREQSDTYLCDGCLKKAASLVEGHPRYYNELFWFIDHMLKERRIPDNGEKQLPITKEFCDTHGFDFEAIKRRLNHTGGYGPGEVLMNSTSYIPFFDRLPLRMDLEPYCAEEDED